MQDIMFWFSLSVFVGQNEQLLLLPLLAKTYRSGDLKFQFQCSVYFAGFNLFLKLLSLGKASCYCTNSILKLFRTVVWEKTG